MKIVTVILASLYLISCADNPKQKQAKEWNRLYGRQMRLKDSLNYRHFYPGLDTARILKEIKNIKDSLSHISMPDFKM
jgi:hypothetical protein